MTDWTVLDAVLGGIKRHQPLRISSNRRPSCADVCRRCSSFGPIAADIDLLRGVLMAAENPNRWVQIAYGDRSRAIARRVNLSKWGFEAAVRRGDLFVRRVTSGD